MQIQATRSSLTPVQIGLITGGNTLPLLGVLFWGWDVFELMLLYWMENIIIGLVTILAMMAIGSREGWHGLIGSLFIGAFFILHYGMFCLGHGVFVFALFYQGDMGENQIDGLFASLTLLHSLDLQQGFYWALAGIVVVQIVQILQNWQNYAGEDFGRVMLSPYGRIITLHVTLIFGGMAVMALGEPVAALVLLIVIKTVFDLGLLKFFRKKSHEHDNRSIDHPPD